jgi:hypothetical protein
LAWACLRIKGATSSSTSRACSTPYRIVSVGPAHVSRCR